MSLNMKRIQDRVGSAIAEIVTDEVKRTVFSDVEKVAKAAGAAVGVTVERKKPGPKPGTKKGAKAAKAAPAAKPAKKAGADRGTRYDVTPAVVLEVLAAFPDGVKSEELRKKHFAKIPPAVLARNLKKLVTGGQVSTSGEKRAMVYKPTGVALLEPVAAPAKESLSAARERELAEAAAVAEILETPVVEDSQPAVTNRLLNDNTAEAE